MDSCVDDTGEVLTVTDKGQGKRTDIFEYRVQSRGGKGIINLKVTNKTGLIIGSKFIIESLRNHADFCSGNHHPDECG